MNEETDKGFPELQGSQIDPEQQQFYRNCLILLRQAQVPLVLGGAFAIYAHTGILRNTKDLDIFLMPENLKKALTILGAAGFETEIRDHLWLAKAHKGSYFVDLIFGIANKKIRVDRSWMESGVTADILGLSIPLIGVEELIASKAYLARADRFDGADIVHLIRTLRGRIDWGRVSKYMEDDYELLLWHMILFQFVYPGHVDYLPLSLMDEIYERMRRDRTRPVDPKAFRGMLVDPVSFAHDCEVWDYEDVRDMRSLVDEDGVEM